MCKGRYRGVNVWTPCWLSCWKSKGRRRREPAAAGFQSGRATWERICRREVLGLPTKVEEASCSTSEVQHTTEALEAVHAQWRAVRENQHPEELAREKGRLVSELIKEHRRGRDEPVVLGRPSFKEFHPSIPGAPLQRRTALLTSNVVRMLPNRALENIWDAMHDWEASGCFPEVLGHTRQVGLPKPQKVQHDTHLDISDLRPVAVMSIWWRTWSSTWARSEIMKEITQEYVPLWSGLLGPEVSAAIVQCALHSSHKGASLDYRQFFDHVNAFLVEALLTNLLPCGTHPWARKQRSMWRKQKRWLTLDGCVHLSVRLP